MKELEVPHARPLDNRGHSYLLQRFPWAKKIKGGTERLAHNHDFLQTNLNGDQWDDRILALVHSPEGKMETFTARAISPNTKAPKYLSGPNGGKDGCLYYADNDMTRPQGKWQPLAGCVFIVEGVLDTVPCVAGGYQTFALLGAHLHTDQLKRLYTAFHKTEQDFFTTLIILLDWDKLPESVKIQRRMQAWGLPAYVGTDLLPRHSEWVEHFCGGDDEYFYKDPGDCTPEEIEKIALSIMNARG